MLFQPKVISMRSSGYITHRTPEIPVPVVEQPRLDEAVETLEYVIQTLSPNEEVYLQQVKVLQARPGLSEAIRAKQAAHQAMNIMISMKKKEIAQILGMTESSFVARYFPKRMDQLWFCVDPADAYRTPLDFLRRVLCVLNKHGEISSACV